jgi:hypothetical protein
MDAFHPVDNITFRSVFAPSISYPLPYEESDNAGGD